MVMQVIQNPPRTEWNTLLSRPSLNNTHLREKVQQVLGQVKQNGDDAVRNYTKQFDGVDLSSSAITRQVIDAAEHSLAGDLKKAIQQAAANIRLFHEKQLASPEMIETMPGIQCWRRPVGIEKVGLYIPGGSAPLFSTILMLAIPAAIAGCKEVVLCSPPGKDGKLHPAILYAARLTGITRVYAIGGVQAIAAMAYGTETVPQVYKIFGPGNQYVTCAKQMVQEQGIAIDMPAGPSEVCVLADGSANAAFVAADLLSQAEHGPDSQVLLVTTDASFPQRVNTEIEKQLALLPRKELAAAALANSKAIVMDAMDNAMELVNAYAAEHLILACRNDEELAQQVVNAGSVFLGHYSPESVGDYASGTNHTLPTNGYAKAYSGVSVDAFVKKITYQRLTTAGLQLISDTVICMAEAEGLDAHAHAVRIRLQQQ
jgi:histidinol dehydrogenase